MQKNVRNSRNSRALDEEKKSSGNAVAQYECV